MVVKYFGTDGIRGHCGQYPITPDFMLKLGWAVGKVFARDGHCKVMIGKDTRISGYMFESSLQAGLSAAGVDVCLLGPMPTPAIAYLTRTFHADAGIMISASHNGYQDNGIKFFSAQGNKLSDELQATIEAMLAEPIECVSPANLGKSKRIDDAAGRYIEFCKATVPGSTDLKGLNIIVDCANGATYHVAPQVLHELGAKVSSIGVKPNGLNINQKCGSTYISTLCQEVIAQQAHLGIAFDGDGDRLIMVDHQGETVDGDELLYIIAADRQRRGVLNGGVVGTQMSNIGLEMGLQKLGISFARAKVGDRYVNALLEQMGWQLGGESSGHIICRDRNSTGDGIVGALQVLLSIQQTGKSLNELKQAMFKMPQTLVNIRLQHHIDLTKYPAIGEQVAELEARLGNTGRVLLRPSGTEPLLRVLVEGENSELVCQYAQQLARDISNILA
jgi:phosphoglucosamine mutase